jgi:hypothetical protein
MADAMGVGIDEGIKETIVAFNVSGISTSASCEGHYEGKGDHRPWPWVAVAAPDEPEERFVGEMQVFQNASMAHGVSLEELRRGHPEELYWEVQKQVSRGLVTPEYQEWEKQNKELHAKITKLIDEFYKDREIDEDARLQAGENDGGQFEVSSEKGLLVKFLDNELTNEERKNLLDKLPRRQKEMQDFTAFLKARFFTRKEK